MKEEQIITFLKDKGLLITDKRDWIIRNICQVEIITDIEEFWIKLRLIRPVSWATIYSTLRLMYQHGLLLRHVRGYKMISYELAHLEE